MLSFDSRCDVGRAGRSLVRPVDVSGGAWGSRAAACVFRSPARSRDPRKGEGDDACSGG